MTIFLYLCHLLLNRGEFKTNKEKNEGAQQSQEIFFNNSTNNYGCTKYNLKSSIIRLYQLN